MMEDIIIIGAGPAGLATALQLRRSGLSPLILERAEIGGLLRNANFVENYPAFPGGITGPELVKLFAEQASRFSIRLAFEEVMVLEHEAEVFRVATKTNERYSQIAVVATGTKPRILSDFIIPRELENRVVYEVCPLLSLEEKHIVIVGASDAAFDYALNLGKNNDITILNRGEQARCLSLLLERAGACPRIAHSPNTTITRLVGAPGERMLLECNTPTGTILICADYVLGAIGREPQLDFISSELLARAFELENRGVLYFAGDVKNDRFRQTAIAVGDGLLAAMKISQKLKECFLRSSSAPPGERT